MKDSHLDPLYQWCLTKFNEDSHPFLPLALSLTYGRLLSTFLLRQAPVANKSTETASTPATVSSPAAKDETKKEPENKKDEMDADQKNEEKTVETKDKKESHENGTDNGAKTAEPGEAPQKETEATAAEKAPPENPVNAPFAPIEPSISEDPAVVADDRSGALVRVEDTTGKLPRLQLTARVADNLNGFVNDLMLVLKIIKDPTQDALAITTVLEKARALLPKGDGTASEVFGKLLVEKDDEKKRVESEKLFGIFSGLTLGWATEKLRRATEAYHDYMWLCDQVKVTDETACRMGWKGAILFKTVAQNQDPQQTYASRRYALLAACAAVGLWKINAVYKNDAKEGTTNGSDSREKAKSEKGSKPPPAKRPRVAASSPENNEPTTAEIKNIVQELVVAAGTEAAFTRWIGGSGGRWKIAADLKSEEIRQAILSFAHLLLVTSDHEKQPQTVLRVVDVAMWWQALSKTLAKLPNAEEWEDLLDDLYDRQSKKEESAKSTSQNIQSFHESAIFEYERQIVSVNDQPKVLLTDKVVWERPTGANPKTAAIVSKGKGGEIAAEVEKRIRDPEVEAIQKRALAPTVYNEGMELNEWAVALLSVEDVGPTEELVALLNEATPGKKAVWKDLLPKIVNKSLLKLLQESISAKVGRKASVSINSDGDVSVSGEMTHDKALCRGIVAFFFHALESILERETGAPIVDETFLRAILTCCMAFVVQAVGMTHKIHPKVKDMPVYSFMQMTESTPMSFLHYTPLFRNSLTHADNGSQFPLPKGLPQRVYREFYNAEMEVLDTVLWAKDPNFEDVLPDRVDDLIETTDEKCCWWPVKVLIDENEEGAEDIMYPSAKEDAYYLEIYHNLSVLMERALEVSHNRMERVCRALGIPHWRLLLKYSWHTFRHLLRQHIKLFYDRHIDHWILTTIYGVGKRMKFVPEITFARTIEAYLDVRGPELGEVQCHRIVRQVKIRTQEGSSQLGHIILLYNKVFIPAMRSHLLKSVELKEATERLVKAVASQDTSIRVPQVVPNISIQETKEPDDVEMATND
eukprot:scaffold31792_cov168-Amphora_coffeaeformis.AAC.1